MSVPMDINLMDFLLTKNDDDKFPGFKQEPDAGNAFMVRGLLSAYAYYIIALNLCILF